MRSRLDFCKESVLESRRIVRGRMEGLRFGSTFGGNRNAGKPTREIES